METRLLVSKGLWAVAASSVAAGALVFLALHLRRALERIASALEAQHNIEGLPCPTKRDSTATLARRDRMREA